MFLHWYYSCRKYDIYIYLILFQYLLSYNIHLCTYCKCIVDIHIHIANVQLFEFSQTKHILVTSMQIKIRALPASPIPPTPHEFHCTLSLPSISLLSWILTTKISFACFSNLCKSYNISLLLLTSFSSPLYLWDSAISSCVFPSTNLNWPLTMCLV